MNKEHQSGEIEPVQLLFKSTREGNSNNYVDRSILEEDSLAHLKTCVGHEIQIVVSEYYWCGCDDEEECDYARMYFKGTTQQVDKNGITLIVDSGEKVYGRGEHRAVPLGLINLPYKVHDFHLRQNATLKMVESIKFGEVVFKLQ